MEEIKQETAVEIFLSQFKDLLVIVLIVAGIVSMITGEKISSIVIFVVIIINAILGTVQTLKAQKSLKSLQQFSVPSVKVIREGTLQVIKGNQLTIGDLVCVEAGDVIEGDGRIIEANNLQINESTLTGESLAQLKQTETIHENCSLGDQLNMAFSSGLVTNGTGKYIVTKIGMETEIGKIATMLENTKERKTPLQITLEDFSKKLTISICVVCAMILALNVFIAHENLLDALLIAVALAVAAIPEALNSIVTIVLSIATQKMVKENAIIKQLNAVESLGCVSVICSDKTGTLTQNKMKVMKLYMDHQVLDTDNLDDSNHSHNVLLKSCALCNNAVSNEQTQIGDPTEIALLDLFNDYVSIYKNYDESFNRINELPFDSVRKLMSVSSQNHIYTKGAVDELLLRCDQILDNDQFREITQDDKDRILAQNKEFAKEGLRVLGFAYRRISNSELTFDDENGLVFVGMVAQTDPPRKESKEAVRQCIQAGIKPIMITGDYVVTAKSIASQIGIFHDGDICLEGRQLAEMSNSDLDEILPKISVYARVAPEHKIRIVEAWQRRDAIVAMTGDGVNDAPALKQSDIGVAMGITGTEVSKDAASMILTDDNFSTIVKAIITGRNVYKNIRNSIIYLLSGNFSAILMVVFASICLLPTPFMAVHLLFINLVTDCLPAIAIGMEKESQEVLSEKPRGQNDSILNKDTIIKIGIEGLIIFSGVLVAYYLGLGISNLMASTMAFSTLCLARLLHGFSSRSNEPIYKLNINPYSIYAFLTGFILLVLILYVPVLHTLFSVGPVGIREFIIICICAFGTFVIVQFMKILSIKRG